MILIKEKKIVLRLPALQTKIGKKRSSIYSMIADGSFPKPIKLGNRSVGWIESEIEEWIEIRIAQRKNIQEVEND